MRKVLRQKLVTTQSELEVQQRDPNSPLYSVRSFEELNLRPELLKGTLRVKCHFRSEFELLGIYQMGFNRPSKIQETALPMLVSQQPQNLIAQSQSGTGKTAAFVLTMLSRIDTQDDTPQCLCLSPTFEVILITLPHSHSFILARSSNGKSRRSYGCCDARFKNLLRTERNSSRTR